MLNQLVCSVESHGYCTRHYLIDNVVVSIQPLLDSCSFSRCRRVANTPNDEKEALVIVGKARQQNRIDSIICALTRMDRTKGLPGKGSRCIAGKMGVARICVQIVFNR